MLRILLIGLVLYFLYRFVFHFLIPLFRVSVAMKQRLETFRNQANQPTYTTQRSSPPSAEKQRPPTDYIEFEEVK